MSRLLPSSHRLGLGLPGYLIPFAPLAFAPQRQLRSSTPLSPPEFLMISTHFTAPPSVPHAPTSLETTSIKGSSPVDRKSTRLNSSHRTISYAVFCLKKKSR